MERVETLNLLQRQPRVCSVDQAELLSPGRALPLGEPAKDGEADRATAEQSNACDGLPH